MMTFEGVGNRPLCPDCGKDYCICNLPPHHCPRCVELAIRIKELEGQVYYSPETEHFRALTYRDKYYEEMVYAGKMQRRVHELKELIEEMLVSMVNKVDGRTWSIYRRRVGFKRDSCNPVSEEG